MWWSLERGFQHLPTTGEMASEVQMEHCMDKVRFLAEDSAWEYLKKTGDKGASIFEIRCKAKRLSTWRYSSVSDRLSRSFTRVQPPATGRLQS